MKGLNLIQDPSELQNLWPVTAFIQAYAGQSAPVAYAMATMTTELGNPDKTAFVLFRMFIQNGERAKTGQKYVLGLKFYSFGDFATLDLVSLDMGFHREIAYEHIKKMGWPVSDEHMRLSVDLFGETTRAPFLFSGGHLIVAADNQVAFSSASQDYGNSVFFADSNSIGAFMASAVGITAAGTADTSQGEAFVQRILKFMVGKKCHSDFYEQFVQEVLSRSPDLTHFTPQQLGSLLMMKVLDRSIKEEKDMIQLLVEETVEGFSRHALVASVVEKIKRGKKR